MKQSLMVAALSLVASVRAYGQAFNIDVSTATVGGAGIGAPVAAFGAAANQAGFWNDLSGLGTGPLGLSDLGGAPSGVTLTRSSGLGGNFNFNSAATTGDFEKLIDDGQDLSATPPGNVTYTISGLTNGTYDVYVYAFAPDFRPDLTVVSVNGSPNQFIGGSPIVPNNTFTVGNTHGIFNVLVTTGTITILADGDAATASFGTMNGIQIVPEPASLFLLALSGIAAVRRRRS